MYAAKSIAAFLTAVITALFASGVVPVSGIVQTVLTIISIVAGTYVTFEVRNAGTDVPKNAP